MTSTDNPASTARDRTAGWQVITGSARGAAHRASGLPNQDAVACRDGPGGVVTVAIADGHGHARHFRSADGSALAVDVACRVVARLAAGAGGAGGAGAGSRAGFAGGAGSGAAGAAGGAGSGAAAAGSAGSSAAGASAAGAAAALAGRLPGAIVADWRSAVAAQLAVRPYTAQEQSLLDLAADPPEVPYGSTLLVAVATADWLVCAQIGDGDMLAVRPDGGIVYPVAADDRLDGLRTTSLCQPDAVASFRTAAHDLRAVPLAALLLATDGYGNSQAEEPWQPGVGRDLAELAAARSRHWFEEQVPGWAQRCASAEGSGDDTTIALLLHAEVGARAARVPGGQEGGLLEWTD
jgi:hypothetical protein